MRQHRPISPGFALPALLLITTILLLVATAVGQIGFTSLKVAAHDRDADQALFAAEAGLVAAAEELTRTGELTQPFAASLPNGAEYEVLYFHNDTTEPMVTVREVEIPPGTVFLYASGLAQERTRNSGILLKSGGGLFRVGALGDGFVLADSTFDSFSSEQGDYPSSLLSDAMIAATNQTSGELFAVTGTQVDGGLFVGPGGDAAQLITADGSSTISRQGALPQELDVPAVVVPDLPDADVEGDGDDGDGSVTSPDIPFTVARTSSVITLDLNVPGGFSMEIQPDGSFTIDNVSETAYGSLQTGVYNINQPPDLDVPARMFIFGETAFSFRSRDNARNVTVTDTEITVVEGGVAYTMPVPDWLNGGGGGPVGTPSVTNPEELVEGRYQDVTINTGETDLVGGTTVVVDNLDIITGGALALPSGSEPVDVYVTGTLVVDGEDAIVNNTRKAPNLNIHYLGDQDVQLSGGSQAYFTLYAPEADISLTGQPGAPTEFFGALIGKNFNVSNANFHFDQATMGIGEGVTGESFAVLARTRF